jgi:hypothetical protein
MSTPGQSHDLSQFELVLAAALEMRREGGVQRLGAWRSELEAALRSATLTPAEHARLAALSQALDESEALLLRLVQEARMSRRV